MGTEYTLFRNEKFQLATYEMAGRFDLTAYKTIPLEVEKCDCGGFIVAVDLYDETMAPEELARMGIECLRTACLQLDPKLELEIRRELADAVPGIFRRINDNGGEAMKLPTRKHRTISIAGLIERAGFLTSEHGENSEYDRALIELIIDAAGLSMNTDRAEVEEAIRQEAARRSSRCSTS